MNGPLTVSQLIEKYSNENEEIPKRIEQLKFSLSNIEDQNRHKLEEEIELEAEIAKYEEEDQMLAKKIELLTRDVDVIASDFEKVFLQYSSAKEDLQILSQYIEQTETKLAEAESDYSKSQRLFSYHCNRIEQHLKFLKEVARIIDSQLSTRPGVSIKELELIELIVGAGEELAAIEDMIKKFRPESLPVHKRPLPQPTRPVTQSRIPVKTATSKVPRPTTQFPIPTRTPGSRILKPK